MNCPRPEKLGKNHKLSKEILNLNKISTMNNGSKMLQIVTICQYWTIAECSPNWTIDVD